MNLFFKFSVRTSLAITTIVSSAFLMVRQRQKFAGILVNVFLTKKLFQTKNEDKRYFSSSSSNCLALSFNLI